LVPYFAFAFGTSFTDRHTSAHEGFTIDDETINAGKQTLSCFAGAIPVGVNWFVGEDVFLGANATAFWAEKTYYNSNVNLAVIFAVGFNMN
jgi:hypothetical protein